MLGGGALFAFGSPAHLGMSTLWGLHCLGPSISDLVTRSPVLRNSIHKGPFNVNVVQGNWTENLTKILTKAVTKDLAKDLTEDLINN